MSLDFDCSRVGIFKQEIKNRFRALVDFDGVERICYIQSSSRLSNYVDLKNKPVILMPNASNKLSFTVFAKKKKQDFMLLCPKEANDIVFSELNRRLFSYLGYRADAIYEHFVEGYKSDIYLPKERTIIEIKAHISESSDSIFPTVYSERTLEQLAYIDKLIDRGFKIVFMICSFNPYTRTIKLDKNSKFFSMISSLLKRGIIIKGYSVSCKNEKIIIKREIPIL